MLEWHLVALKRLELEKVFREFGDEEDKMNKIIKCIQEQNDQCTIFLTCHGYDVSASAC